jgi:hypothetical protein
MQVPPGFEPLLAWEAWAVKTPNLRTAKRRASTREELKSFYDAMQPWIEKILDACDAYELGKLPQSHRDIYSLALSLAEVAPHVELYKGAVGVPFSFEESRFIAVHGDDEFWKGEAPNRPRIPAW